jgi:Protein of unknown function (DUF1097)
MKKPPAEVVASLLAVTTIFISLPPWNLPPWAIFISWAGTFAAGGPRPEVLRKIWPVMPVGSLTAFLIVLAFAWASHHYAGTSFLIAQCVILFCLNAGQMLLARIPGLGLGFVPGMFFGFASYFATFFGGFGPSPHDPVAALVAVVLMNALGPLYAWLNVKLAAPHGHHDEAEPVVAPVRR